MLILAYIEQCNSLALGAVKDDLKISVPDTPM